MRPCHWHSAFDNRKSRHRSCEREVALRDVRAKRLHPHAHRSPPTVNCELKARHPRGHLRIPEPVTVLQGLPAVNRQSSSHESPAAARKYVDSRRLIYDEPVIAKFLDRFTELVEIDWLLNVTVG